MQDKDLQQLLRSADDKTLEQIAADYAATDSRTQECIWDEICRRRQAASHGASVKYTHIRRHIPPRWVSSVCAAAALVLAAGTAGNIVWQLRQSVQQPGVQESQGAETSAMEQTAAMTAVLPSETELPELTKELIYARCSSTIRYLTQLSGHIEIWDSTGITKNIADVQLDYDKGLFYGVTQIIDLTDNRTVHRTERYVSDGTYVDFGDVEDWDFTYPDGTPGHEVEHRYCSYDLIGKVDRSHFNNDVTGLHAFAACFQPIDMTLGYLSDLDAWEITETEMYQNRECAVIEGTSESYGSRWNVTHFKIRVDIATGVWLFYEGYGEDGKINDYLYTSDMVFGDSSMQVPTITQEEIDRSIEAGYKILNEWDEKARQQDLEERAAGAEKTEAEEGTAGDLIVPEVMPEPFASGTPVPEDYYRLCEPRFTDIPTELKALVPEDALTEWQASYTSPPEYAVTSLGDDANMYTLMQHFELSKEDVSDALADYIAAPDAETSLRADELEAIVSGNKPAMAQDFASKYTIVIGGNIYTPQWFYEHSIQEYAEAGIPPQMVAGRMELWHFDFTPEAEYAFFGKLRAYTAQER